MSPTAMAKKLEQAQKLLQEVREALAEPGTTEPEGQAPEVNPARRTIIYRGVTVPLTTGQTKLAELLLRHVGAEVPFNVIDRAARDLDADWCSREAIRQSVARLRRRLRAGGLSNLADGLRAGSYGTYVWVLSPEITKCHTDCPGKCGMLSVESERES